MPLFTSGCLDLGLGLVILVLVLRIWSCLHHWAMQKKYCNKHCNNYSIAIITLFWASELNEKSAQRRRKHCALAVVRRSKKILPRRRPPSRGCRMAKILSAGDGQLPLPTNPVWWDWYTQFRVIVVTDPHTHKHTHPHTDGTDYNTLCHS